MTARKTPAQLAQHVLATNALIDAITTYVVAAQRDLTLTERANLESACTSLIFVIARTKREANAAEHDNERGQ